MKDLSLFVTKTARELESLERSITTLREEAVEALEDLLKTSPEPRSGEGASLFSMRGTAGHSSTPMGLWRLSS
jgi:hypothetical protein